MPHVNIFDKDDFEALQRAKRMIHDQIQLFDKAETCGVECQAMRELATQLQGRLESIQREFMTPQPA